MTAPMKMINRSEHFQGMGKFPDEVRSYHERQAGRARFAEICADWIRRGLPDLRAFASGFREDVVFVLGTGPSLKEVTARQWERLGKGFTIGVNKVAIECNRMGVEDVPKLGLVVDELPPQDMKLAFWEPHCRQGSRVLVSEDIVSMPRHYAAPCPVWFPDWGLEPEVGLPCTMMIGPARYGLAIIAAAYLGACLKRKVVLLGVDHGPDYGEHETVLGNLMFADLREFLEKHNRTLVNAGEKTSIEALDRVNLEEVLDANGL